MRPTLNIPPGRRFVQGAMAGLLGVDVAMMERRPYPFLYETGVRYSARDPGEHWQNADELLKRGVGDCEDLAAYMCAWLRVYRGCRCRVHVYRTGKRKLHAVVELADGTIIDPSKKLGMGRKRK